MKPCKTPASGTGGSRPVSHATGSGSRPRGKSGPSTPTSAPMSAQKLRSK